AAQAAWAAFCSVPMRNPHHDPVWAAYAIAYAGGNIRERAVKMWDGGCWSDLSMQERVTQACLLRDLFGNPFKPLTPLRVSLLRWNGGLVPRLAQTAYDDRHLPSGHLAPDRLGVLADALTDAGCADAELLEHLRGEGPHLRGCYAVDCILGKT